MKSSTFELGQIPQSPLKVSLVTVYQRRSTDYSYTRHLDLNLAAHLVAEQGNKQSQKCF